MLVKLFFFLGGGGFRLSLLNLSSLHDIDLKCLSHLLHGELKKMHEKKDLLEIELHCLTFM